MVTSISTEKTHRIASRICSMILLCGAMMLSTALTTGAHAAPANYVRICDTFGGDFFYSPGSDTCVNAQTGETRQNTAYGTVVGKTEYRATADKGVAEAASAARKSYAGLRGVAISTSMPTANVQCGQTFALSPSLGTYKGYSSVGLAGAVQANSHLSLTASAGSSLDDPGYGARVGFNFAW